MNDASSNASTPSRSDDAAPPVDPAASDAGSPASPAENAAPDRSAAPASKNAARDSAPRAESQDARSSTASAEDLASAKQLTLIVYALQGAALFVGVTFIVAVIINYIKRPEVEGTWLASHFEWQIKTFWYTLLYGVIGGITALFLVGFVILAIGGVWTLYRIVKGAMRLNEDAPMYAGASGQQS
jgi:uncharacterized membrane protein